MIKDVRCIKSDRDAKKEDIQTRQRSRQDNHVPIQNEKEMSCSASTSAAALDNRASTSICPRIRHLVSGTFNSPFLHLLSFDTLTRTLSILSTLPGYGPHSFLAVGRTANAAKGVLVDTVYATTWAEDKPELIAWRVKRGEEEVQTLEWLGNVPISE